MAKVRDNLVTEGLSGKLGKRLVFRQGRNGKTIVATRPVYSTDRVYNEAQLEQQEAFRQATTYAKVAKDQPLYVELAKDSDASAYNLAVADWFGRPEILNIDPRGWSGQAGQTIHIRAQDDTRVTGVSVVIHDNGAILEEGEAVLSSSDGLLWVYTTSAVLPTSPAPMLEARAQDLAGNIGAQTIQLN